MTAEGQGDTGEGGGGLRQTLNSHSNSCSRILPRGAFHDFVNGSWRARCLDFSRILKLHWWVSDLLFVLVVVVANRDRHCCSRRHAIFSLSSLSLSPAAIAIFMTACTAATVCKSTTIEIRSILWYFYVLCAGQQKPSSTEDPLDQSSTVSWTGVRRRRRRQRRQR